MNFKDTTLINIFKVDNLVYGSNWPVIKTNSDYIQQFEFLLNTYEQFDKKNPTKYFITMLLNYII